METSNCYYCGINTLSKIKTKVVNWLRNNSVVAQDEVIAEYCEDCGCLKYGESVPIKNEAKV